MKRLLLGTFTCLALVFVSSVFAQSCFANGSAPGTSPTTWWTPGPSGATFTFNLTTSDDSFGIFSKTGYSLPLFSTLNGYYSTTLTFAKDASNTWSVSAFLNNYVTGETTMSGPLSLGPQKLFGFGFNSINSNYSFSGGPSYYALTGPKGEIIGVANASPTPIPAPAALLGCGLLGLIGFGVRRRPRA